jgi:Holliday junction resolvase RusA-like endonuclease
MAKRKQEEIVSNLEQFLICRIEYQEEAKNPNNAYFRSANTGKGFKGMFMKADYKAYKNKLIDLAKSIVGGDFVPYEGDVKIISYWTFGTKRRKDLQNCGKLEFDALNGIVYLDDSQPIEDHRYKIYQKDKPLVVIEVYGYK